MNIKNFFTNEIVIPYVRKVLDITQLKANEFFDIFRSKGYNDNQLLYIKKLYIIY